jgi:hypothetical protein
VNRVGAESASYEEDCLIIKKLFSGLWLSFLATAAAAQLAQPQQIDPPRLEVTPSTVMPGMPFAVTLSHTFPFVCGLSPLGPGQMVDTGTLDPVRRAFRINFVPDLGVPCDPTPTAGEDSFGVFRLPANVFDVVEPGQTLEVIFQVLQGVHGGLIAEAPLRVVNNPAQLEAPLPTSGIYWDPRLAGNGLAGNGFALEMMDETSLFMAAFSYGSRGEGQWWTVEGQLAGGVLEAPVLHASGGACLLCGDPFIPPGERQSGTPLRLIVRGQGEVFLSLGSQPQRVLSLLRFEPQQLPPGANLPGARWPILAGEWIFADLTRDRRFQGVRFTEREEDEFGRSFTTGTADGRVRIECPRLGMCEITLDGANYPLRRADLTPDRLSGPGFVGVRRH